MEEQTLGSLEEAVSRANQEFDQKYTAMENANAKVAEAEAAYKMARQQINMNGTRATPTQAQMEQLDAAAKELKDAKAEAKVATQTVEVAADKAQAALDAVEDKKEELRASREDDTNFVVCMARVECSCGLRESYLLLEETHGVHVRQCPQMLVKDIVLDENIINFGGCTSIENPSTIKAAEEALAVANASIEQAREEAGFLTKVVDCFTNLFNKNKNTEVQMDESFIRKCVGECVAEFPEGTGWLKGHEKVTINGEAPLLRRCDIMCNYGGQITILLCGQPE